MLRTVATHLLFSSKSHALILSKCQSHKTLLFFRAVSFNIQNLRPRLLQIAKRFLSAQLLVGRLALYDLEHRPRYLLSSGLSRYLLRTRRGHHRLLFRCVSLWHAAYHSGSALQRSISVILLQAENSPPSAPTLAMAKGATCQVRSRVYHKEA